MQHCKAGWARPIFSILGKDKGDPNNSVLQFGCFSKVSTLKQSNQIEAIGYGIASIWTSPSKTYKNTACLWVLLINYNNFSRKLTRIVHFCEINYSVCIYIYNFFFYSYSGLLKLKFMLFWALWPAPIRRGSIPDRGHGVKKRCWGRQGNMFLGNFVVFYRKNASPVPTPVQIEAIVNESVCFTNCFYLKRTRLHMDLGLLLFEKILNIF